jgi:hypothetical protein
MNRVKRRLTCPKMVQSLSSWGGAIKLFEHAICSGKRKDEINGEF